METIYSILTLFLMATAAIASPTTTAPNKDLVNNTTTSTTTVPSVDIKTCTDNKIGTTNTSDDGSVSMQKFRRSFPLYERRIKIFIENMQRTHAMMNSENVKFMDEIDKYEDRLPTNRTKYVVKKYRSKCYCEGTFHSPCPERCMESCHYCSTGGRCWYDSDNCSAEISKIGKCYCYDGSETRCDQGELEKCYWQKTVEEPVVQPCAEFATNRTILETSYRRFSELLIEPFVRLVRDLDFQLGYLKQSVISTGILNDIILRTCAEQDDTSCLPEAKAMVAEKLTNCKQLQRTLTLEMIKTQEQAEKASKNVNNLKGQTLTQLNLSIKNYTCCLQGLSFSVTDNDCNLNSKDRVINSNGTDLTMELPTLSSLENSKAQQCNMRGDFLCDNNRCVPNSYRCDGEDDCGDFSDELC